MSSTRHATDDSVYRQERYASSPEFQKGLQANLVAKRCNVLANAADRELIYFLLLLSHREGGLKRLVSDLIASYPERIATNAMHEIGTKRKNYNAERVRKIRSEFPDSYDCRDFLCRAFPLKGDVYRWHSLTIDEQHPCWNDLDSREKEKMRERLDEHNARQAKLPSSYSVEVLQKACIDAAREKLERDLSDLCLDPAWSFHNDIRPWYFPALIQTLREYQSAWLEERRAELVMTEVCEKVFETLDYSLEGRCLTMIRGLDGLCKTFAAKMWCELHPGQARYVLVPPGSSDIEFFRAIAEALGVSRHLNSKAHELRDRIETVLRTGHMMLVFDDAHRLFPESNYRDALPFRVSWIVDMVERGAPIALVVSPQFFNAKKRLERRAGWDASQFLSDIAHCEDLPQSISEKSLTEVAEFLLPEGNARMILSLTDYARTSAKSITGIKNVVTRARFLAHKDGREKVEASDVARAISQAAIRSDAVLNHSLAQPEKRPRQRTKTILEMPAARQSALASASEIPTRESQPMEVE